MRELYLNHKIILIKHQLVLKFHSKRDYMGLEMTWMEMALLIIVDLHHQLSGDIHLW